VYHIGRVKAVNGVTSVSETLAVRSIPRGLIDWKDLNNSEEGSVVCL